jgi:hypothetical protein
MATPELFNPDTVAAPLGRYSHVARVKAGSDLLFKYLIEVEAVAVA